VHLKKVAVELVDAVADVSAKEVMQMKMQLPLKWEVVVVDVSPASLAVALESTLADTAGELFIIDSNI
jgi:hypothetical protein